MKLSSGAIKKSFQFWCKVFFKNVVIFYEALMPNEPVKGFELQTRNYGFSSWIFWCGIFVTRVVRFYRGLRPMNQLKIVNCSLLLMEFLHRPLSLLLLSVVSFVFP